MITAISGPLSAYRAQHLRLEVEGAVATLTLDRPERKNPLTFESYAEMAAILRAAAHDDEVRAFVITGAGGNFCSGRSRVSVATAPSTSSLRCCAR